MKKLYKYGIRIFPNRKWYHNLFKCHKYTARGGLYDMNGNYVQRFICSCGKVTYSEYVAARSKM